jgi:hypothetical protein
MRTVLGKAAGRAGLILVSAGMVGSAALPAVPASAGAVAHRTSKHQDAHPGVRIGDAVKYVRDADGTVRRVR